VFLVSGRQEALLVCLLLAAQAALLGYGVLADGLTYDELLYISAGYRELKLSDYRFGAEHPPLAQMVSALPLLAYHPKTRALEAEDGASWAWAHEFLDVDNAGLPLMRAARIPTVVLSLLLSFGLWRWCRALAGPFAGLIALGLGVFHPSLLAHGHLVTTDMPGTVTMVAASYALWRWCEGPTSRRALAVGLALGIAFATRLTALLLVPVIAGFALRWWWRSSRDSKSGSRIGQLATACVLGVLFCIWTAYGFHWEPWPGVPEAVIGARVWEPAIEGTVGGRVLGLLKASHVVPSAYVTSIQAYLIKSTVGHQAFLLGQISASGWPYYYAVALLVKNTPAFLVAMLCGAALWRRADRAGLEHALVPSGLIFLAASFSRVQVGERYMLAAYAYLIVGIAPALTGILRESTGRAFVGLLLGAHALSSLLQAPDGHIPYFNAMVGRDLAPFVLSDSNLDWGQDLPRLATWGRAHPDRPLQLAYWGSDLPSRYGIVREDLPGQTTYGVEHPPRKPYSGWVAISSTLLSGLYPPPGTDEVYEALRRRTPDDHAGVFRIYDMSH
jgi:4-amino-4-deoxy-L-arabinose transferase-like glycosyltransferase